MFNFLFKKTDSEIQRDVINELNWDLMVTARQLSVLVRKGIVTLRGCVPRYIERSQIGEAALRVVGVKSIANQIKVNVCYLDHRSDEQIVTAALKAIRGSYVVPKNIRATAKEGWITLTGRAAWDSQSKAAKIAVGQVKGISGITNDIVIDAV
tara:strand:+ start:27880 stop:28338 length:459 start_codon:yes stop_codon:yes gene_type:complete